MSLVQQFPNLSQCAFQVTSPAAKEYNCIAWAAGFSDRWWWPDRMGQSYWPSGVPRQATIDAFIAAFETLGYEKCPDGTLEEGFEKVALYSRGTPMHAARQLTDGKWTSKLGKSEDISHDTVNGVEGQIYGTVEIYMKRPAHRPG